MRPMKHPVRVPCIIDAGRLPERAEETIEFVRRQDARQFARSADGDGRPQPRVRDQ